MAIRVLADGETRRQNRIEACRTYLEQTKLLVTLASAFIIAPAAVIALEPTKIAPLRPYRVLLIVAESLFVASVLAGYFVLATVAGSQADGSFNIYRKATMFFSRIQLLTYLLALAGFVWLIARMLS